MTGSWPRHLLQLAHLRIGRKMRPDGIDNFHHPPAADRTFAHHNQFRLVGGGPDQPPGAIGKTEPHAIDRDHGSDRRVSAKMIGHPLHDFIFDLIGAMGRHGGRSPGLRQFPVEIGHGFSRPLLQHAQDFKGGEQSVVIAPAKRRLEKIMARFLEAGERALLRRVPLHVGMAGLPVFAARPQVTSAPDQTQTIPSTSHRQ